MSWYVVPENVREEDAFKLADPVIPEEAPPILYKVILAPVTERELSAVPDPRAPPKVADPAAALTVKPSAPVFELIVPVTLILPPDWLLSRERFPRRTRFPV